MDQLFLHGAHLLAQIGGGGDERLLWIGRTKALLDRLKLRAQFANPKNGLVHFLQAVAHLEYEFELLAQIIGRSLDARVHFHFERRDLRFSGHREPHLVCARQNERADWIACVINRQRNFCRHFVAQVPGETVEACLGGDVFFGGVALPFFGGSFLFLFLAGVGADDFALAIEYFEFGWFFGLFLQVKVKNCSRGRIFTNGIAARVEVTHPRANGGPRREKMRGFRGNGCAGLAQGAHVVQHPERSAVSGDHQIVVVDDHVVDGSRGKIELKLLPVRSIVK